MTQPAEVTQPAHGLVDWGDQNFTPATSPSYSDDPIRFFRMSHSWPTNPPQGRKFQLGGKERVAILEQDVYHCWSHSFSIQHMGSGTNGTRRCTLETLGRCLACEHYEQAPDKQEDGRTRKHGMARCSGRKQTFGVNLLVYKTDLEGNLIDAANNRIVLDPNLGPVLEGTQTPAELMYEVFLWRFSADKFQSIREIKSEWGDLRAFDLMFTLAPGKPENFQDFSPTVLRSAAWIESKKQGEEKAKAVVQYFKDTRYNVEAILGKEYSHDDMQRFLFGDGAAAANGGAPTTNAADIAREIEESLAAVESRAAAPAPPAASTEPAPAATVTPPPPPPQQPAGAAAVPPAVEPAQSAVPPTPPAPEPTDFDALLNS